MTSQVSAKHKGSNRQLVETPLKGEFEGKALYLSTRLNTPGVIKDGSTTTSRRLSKVVSLPCTPSPFDPTADFNFESEAVSPDILENRVAALKDSYHRLCRSSKGKVIPCSAFIKQIGSTALDLRELKLSRNEFKAILSTLVNDSELVHVNMSGNPTTSREAGYIGELLKSNKFITHLTLSDMTLTGKGMSTLAKTMKACMGLIKVDLSSNFLCDKDGDSICNIIDDTDGIRELILHHNQLGDCGVQLGRSLADNVTLTTLDLSWNHIRGQGAVGIARGLQRNQHLTNVILAWNGFGFEGCVALSFTLHHNTSIQVLDMTSNRIHLPALHKLTDGLVKNKVLTKLLLGLNPIPAHCTSYLLSRLMKWKHSNLKELDLQGTVVDRDFEPLLKVLQEERLFMVRYDKALLQKSSMTSASIDPNNIYNIDPVRILFFMKQHLRTIDLFLKIDKDVSGSLSKDEMKYAFELEGFPISDMALDQVMRYLDTNNDGAVDLREFFEGERRSRRGGKPGEDEEEEEEKVEETSNRLKPAINMIKYSQAFKKPPPNKSPALSPRRSNTMA